MAWLIALDVEGRGKARRAARETPTATRVLRTFLDRSGAVPVDEIVAGLQRGPAGALREALLRLDDDDLIRIRDGHVDIAYPFSASPTAFVVRLPDGRERYACCAIDALGIAPMVGQPVEIRSRCHHCGTPLEFSGQLNSRWTRKWIRSVDSKHESMAFAKTRLPSIALPRRC